MPVYHSYVNDDGYYITARPSDVGNITYQTTTEADELLTELGYEDEDNLPWGLINPFRAAGLIFTNGQGVKADLDDAPDLDPSKLESLSPSKAEELLAYFDSRKDIPEEVYNQLQEIIEDEQKPDYDILGDAIDAEFPDQVTHTKMIWKTESTEFRTVDTRQSTLTQHQDEFDQDKLSNQLTQDLQRGQLEVNANLLTLTNTDFNLNIV